MLNGFGRVSKAALLVGVSLGATAPAIWGQAQTETPLQRQLKRFDLGVSGIGVFTGSSSGENYATSSPRPDQAQSLTQSPSNTLGALVTLRYTKSPLLGAEFNYTYARYTEDFSAILPGGVQTNVSEYSVGYVAHGPALTSFAIRPFASVGAGSTAFTPTPFGGQGLLEQARATYYYAAGIEAPIYGQHLSVRGQVRQAFFLAPDFGANYLTIKQHTSTFEPAFGFVLHY